MTSLGRHTIIDIEGAEHIAPERDPFILCFNHSQRPEAVIVPTTLIWVRRGKLLHFMADWNFALIPVVGTLFRLSEVIMIVRKPARPAFLNRFKKRYEKLGPAMVQAARKLEAGRSLGVFPEGTVNRDPARLLAGWPGAARLSLEHGVPIVPGGIRFPKAPAGAPIRDLDRMSIRLGAPMAPPSSRDRCSPDDVKAWHHSVMSAIADLSGKRAAPPRERAQGRGA